MKINQLHVLLIGSVLRNVLLSNQFLMKHDADEPLVPYEFRRGIIDYAVAQAYRSDEMYAQSNVHMTDFNEAVKGCMAKMSNQGQEQAFPTMRMRNEYEWGYPADDYYDVGYATPETDPAGT